MSLKGKLIGVGIITAGVGVLYLKRKEVGAFFKEKWSKLKGKITSKFPDLRDPITKVEDKLTEVGKQWDEDWTKLSKETEANVKVAQKEAEKFAKAKLEADVKRAEMASGALVKAKKELEKNPLVKSVQDTGVYKAAKDTQKKVSKDLEKVGSQVLKFIAPTSSKKKKKKKPKKSKLEKDLAKLFRL